MITKMACEFRAITAAHCHMMLTVIYLINREQVRRNTFVEDFNVIND